MTAGWLSPQRRAVLRQLRERGGGAADRIRPAAPGEPAVLSPAQRRLWLFDQLRPGHPLYNVAGGVWLRGPLDVAVLRRALTETGTRHHALRTTYRPGPDGDAVPELLATAEAELPVTAVADPPAAVDEARVLAAVPVDPSVAPVRYHLLRVDDRSHLLVVVLHHLAADGWSLGVLLRELVTRYGADAAGTPAPLPPLPIQYADWARWQERRLPAVLDAHLPYWRETLDGAAPLELPTDRPRPARPEYAGAIVELALPGGTGPAAVAERLHATPFSVVLAVVAAVLSRWSGQTDLVLGVPAAGRDRPEVGGLVGFFVNTLPIRLDLSGAPTVADLVERTARAVLDAQSHGEVPYDVLVERLRPASGGGVPLVRHMVQYDPEPPARVRVGELELDLLPLGTGTAKFDLELFLAPTAAGGLTGRIEYSTELYDPGSVTALARALGRALAGARPELPVAELPLLDGAESARLDGLSGRATPPVPAPVPTVHGLVAAQARRTPDLVAVQHEHVTRTYRELDEGADRLARVLQARGVRRGSLVGIRLRRGPDLLTALLAVLKAGAAYLPLDPDLPPARIEQMRADAEAAVTITDSADPVGTTAPGGIDLHRDAGEIAAQPAGPLAGVRCGGRDLAYVIYTSGSTGRPKGAMNEHRAVVNRLLWMQERFGLEPGEGVLQKTPLGFDVSVWELFWPLLVGARCVLARPGGHRDPAYLAELIIAADVTTVHFVPSMLAQFVPAAPAGLPLRRVVCSGEELPAELVDQVARWSPEIPVFNLYGPTEAAVDVSWHPAAPRAGVRVPIGRPIAGAALYVVDPGLRAVPVGMLGELLIGGIAVGRGYLRRPGLTAERFVPDPFGPPGGRLYRTGDLARWRPDGTLEYRGRIDSQVKIRGMRVEPGEVEAVLAEHPLVDSAVVDPRPGPDGALRLVGYVRPAAGAPAGEWRSLLGTPGEAELPDEPDMAELPDEPDMVELPDEQDTVELPDEPDMAELGRLLTPYLRAYLRQRLPAYLVPDRVVAVADWPLSPNGKLDRRRLPDPEPSPGCAPYLPPATDLERRLAGIWAELLGVERVGGADDFFDLGGHSLLAIRVIARVRAELAVEVAPAELFAAPTISGLAAAVTAAGTRPAALTTVRRVDRRPYRAGAMDHRVSGPAEGGER